MKENLLGVKKTYLIIYVTIFLFFMVLGSLYDYQLTDRLYNPNKINSAIANYYSFPLYIIHVFSGVALFKGLKKLGHTAIAFIALLLCLLLVLKNNYMFFNNFIHINNTILNTAISATGVIIFFGIFTLIGFKIITDNNPQYLIYIGLLIILGFFVSTSATQIIKKVMTRPRYYFLIAESNNISELSFANWWECKLSFNLNSNFLNNYASFPSGHMCTTGILFTLPLFNKVLKKPILHGETFIFIFAFTINILIAYNRLATGAHFLTDIAFGSLFALGIYVSLYIIFGKKITS